VAYHKYYLDRLYPLQDKFLTFLNEHNKGRYYLTGGTALSRFYYQHRFSEDLDFFTTTELKDFRQSVTSILNEAKKQGFSFEVETVSDSFFHIFSKGRDVSLKIDFVNEVVFHCIIGARHPGDTLGDSKSTIHHFVIRPFQLNKFLITCLSN
jgi:hypothetical protein